ncbi:MAG TPA: hypothetical protein VLR71_04585 [Casimicrobiaceae bacterium]|nr:hypothetical protein [Casimicrobiaceae bacterium]
MADYTVNPETPAGRQPPVTGTLVVYALFGVAAVAALLSHGLPLIAPLFGLLGLIAIIMAYVQRSDAAGTWVASHLRWLIRTFWWSLLWAILGGLILVTLGLILIGIPIAFAVWIVDTLWVFYRLIRGFLLFKDSRPVPGME